MLNFFQKQNPLTTQANIVDGKLILTLPGALTPAVWQMDLAGTKASAMEVTPEGDLFSLTLKTPKGERMTIASFEAKEHAVQTLLITSNALKNAHGQIAANDDTAAPIPAFKKSSLGAKIFKIFSIICVLIVIYLAGILLFSGSPSAPTNASTISSNSQSGTSGVPMSADDFLSGQ